MNLISRTHHSCERKEYAFIILREYTIISRFDRYCVEENLTFIVQVLANQIREKFTKRLSKCSQTRFHTCYKYAYDWNLKLIPRLGRMEVRCVGGGWAFFYKAWKKESRGRVHGIMDLKLRDCLIYVFKHIFLIFK